MSRALLSIVSGVALACAIVGCASPPSVTPPAADPVTTAPTSAATSWRLSAGGGSSVRVETTDGAAIELRTVALGHGVARRPLADVAPSLASDRATVSHGECVEEVELHGRRVEQRWRFATRPSEGGDLSVQVALGGVTFVSAQSDGLYFDTGVPGVRARYSHATWVDADGHRTAVDARWDGGRITLSVPDEVLRRSSYPAVLDPTLDTLLDADPGWTASLPYKSQFSGSVVISPDGSTGAVVWTEQRMLVPAGMTSDGMNVLVARFDPATGTVIDRAGIPLYTTPQYLSGALSGRGAQPTVAASTSRFVITVPLGARLDVFSIPQRGAISVRPTPWAMSRTGVTITDGTVGCIGNTCLALASGGSIFGSRFDAPSLAPLDASPVTLVASVSAYPGTMSMTTNGSEYLAAWSTSTVGPFIRRFAGDATAPLGSTVQLGTTYGGPTTIVDDPTGWIIGWASTPSTTAATYAMRRASTDLTLSPLVTIGPGSGRPALARLGGTLGLALPVQLSSGASQLQFARFDATTLALLDRTARVIAGPSGANAAYAMLATAGSRWLLGVQWHNSRYGLIGVSTSLASWATTHVNDDGTTDPTFVDLTGSNPKQEEPRIATDGTYALVVWEEQRAEGLAVMGTRVRMSDGALVDATPVRISPVSDRFAGCPSVTAGGGSFFVSWVSAPNELVYYLCYGVAHGMRLDPATLSPRDATSTALDPVAFTSVAKGRDASGFDGTSFVTLVQGTDGHYLMRERASDGVVTTPGGEFLYATTYFDGLSTGLPISCDTSGCVTWGNRYASGHHQQVVLGLPGGAWPTTVTTSDFGSFFTRYPPLSVVVRGTQAYKTSGVALATFSTSGTSRGGPLNSIPVPTYLNLAVAPTGESLITTLTSDRASVYDVDSSLTVNTTPWSLNPATTQAVRPAAAASLGPGRWLVVYDELMIDSPQGNRRLRFALAHGPTTGAANGARCAIGSECSTGFCVDGVCCNASCGGTVSGDCQACSVAAGATVDGTCGLLRAGQVCRAASGACDTAEVCSGAASVCPADVLRPDGTPCGDTLVCNGIEQCRAGSCNGSNPPVCDDHDPCTADMCAEPGGCRSVPIAGCGLDASTPDVSAVDAAVDGVIADVATPDAMTVDATVGDVVSRDAVTSDVIADAATPDVVADVARPDAVTDAATPDAIVRDASVEDASPADVAMPDAVTRDASVEDAITSDVVPGDVSASDATSVDASDDATSGDDVARADAFVGDGATETTSGASSGCGCDVPGRASSARLDGLAAAAALVVSRRRRRPGGHAQRAAARSTAPPR